ncbi:MAG: DUF362 domain-containing protein [Candidatus Bathyarchaeota archaeon]|jgi:uncharacterized protein (DUF362 family)/NAD-dependent dihydropyrimidine dehydrogenase PreA subunit
MKPQVAIVRAEGSLEDAVREAVSLLGGIGDFARPGETILVKPNLFTTISAEKGATTDLRIFMALTRMLQEAGAEPVVGECPATSSYARPDIVFDGLGVREVCREAGVEINVLDREEPVRVESQGAEVQGEFWFPRFALECDGIFNVPKLKTHTLTKMTCAVKNLFGLQQGGTKANHHVQTGNDPESFSHLLVDLYACIRDQVTLNVVDAVVAMEGEGPTTGDPVDLGLVIAGDDAVAVDLVAAAVMGWDPLEVGTSFLAVERGLGPKSLEGIEVVGEQIPKVARGLRRPQTHSDGQMFIDARMPLVCDPERCTACGICAEVCPADAIEMRGTPDFDDTICIQCFCCIELCPNKALSVVREDR